MSCIVRLINSIAKRFSRDEKDKKKDENELEETRSNQLDLHWLTILVLQQYYRFVRRSKEWVLTRRKELQQE